MPESTHDLGVLFADVSDSSRLYRSLGDDGGRRVVLRCLELLGGVVEAHDGRVIDRIGDELMCTFPDPRRTVAAAGAMQAAVQAARSRGELPDALEIRIGLHCGPVLVDGDRIFGDTVYTAKRVAVLAKPRQVLTTGESVRRLDAAEQSVPARWIDRTRVKGGQHELDLFELIWSPTDLTLRSGGELPDPPGAEIALRHAGSELRVGRARPSVTLGRNPACDLVIQDAAVSRLHARIEHRKGRFSLTDLSINGTWVDDAAGRRFVHRDSARLSGDGVLVLGSRPRRDGANVVEFSAPSSPRSGRAPRGRDD